MLVSYKLLKEYVDLKDISLKEMCDALSRAGFELEGFETLASGTNLVIGEVLECVNHPNSDHLHITKTNIGNEVIQIVCGAPNCKKGLKVIVALPGAYLPAKNLTIAKGKIRDVESNGMLCSLLELGVNENMLTDYQKAGIEELPLDAPVGYDNPLEYLNLDDTIIDFSITPNRADVLGLNNFFKEVAAILNTKVIKQYQCDLNRSGTSKFKASSDTSLCSYFSMTTIDGIKVKPSPIWMQNILSKHGIKCINNVVDIGNYVTLMTGQPLHMYDASKLENDTFIVKDDVNTKVLALDDKEYELTSGDLAVTNNNNVVCIAGVIGNHSTMINDNTTTIALEVALFDGPTIMNSCKKYGIMTVAATNYSKNAVDKYNVLKASDMACDLLVKYADAKNVSNANIYDNRNLVTNRNITISLDYVNERLGTSYSLKQVADVFKRLDFKYQLNDNIFDVDVPTYRNDISIKEDLLEEIVRLIGFDTIPYTLTTVAADKYGLTTKQKAIKIIHNYLLDLGLTNTLSYSLMNKENATYYGIFDDDSYIVLAHPLTVEKECLRKNMIYSMLNSINYNQSRNIKNAAIYEISSVYTNENLNGNERLAIAISNGLNEVKWLDNKKVNFFMIKGIVEGLLALFKIEPNRYTFEPLKNYYKEQTIFHPGKSAVLKINGKVIGMLGEIHPATLKKEGIDPTIYFEMDLDAFMDIKTGKVKYSPVSKFPSVTRDLAIIVKDDISVDSIIRSIKKAGGQLLKDVEVFDVYKGEHVENGYKSIALTMTFVDANKTLVDATINELFNKIYSQCQKDFKAVIRN